MNHYLLYIIIIILLLILIIYIKKYNILNNLKGFWSASEEFCRQCKINCIWIYINNNNLWILIKKNNTDILNQITTYNININKYSIFNFIYSHKSFIKGNLLLNLNNNNFPDKLLFKLYPNIGRLILYSNNNVYTDLYKNTRLTDLGNYLSCIDNNNNKISDDDIIQLSDKIC